MNNYFTDIIFKIDAALLVFTGFLIVAILFFASTKIYFERRRIKKLQIIKKNVYRIVLTEKESVKNETFSAKYCSLPMFLDVAANRVKEGVFFNDAEQEVFRKMCVSVSRVKKILSTAARSLSKWRRIEAMLFLGYAGISEASQVLKKNLNSSDEDIAYFAAVSLGQIKNIDSARSLLAFLKKNPKFRYKTASFLEQFPKEIVCEVIKLSDDKDHSIRFWAPQILAGLNDPYCIDKMKDLLADKYPEVRASACQCLGAIGDEACVASLRKCLKDESWFVREAAMESLEKILGEGCIPLVVDLIRDNSWVVIDRLKKILAKNITTALPYLENLLLGKDDLSKRISIEIIEISGYVKKLYESLLDNGPAKARAVSILKAMRAQNAKGLDPDLYSFSPQEQKQIHEILK